MSPSNNKGTMTASTVPITPLNREGPVYSLNNQSGERPVGPDEAAAFLKVARSTVMAWARTGKIPAHAVTNGRRKRWLFFLSELESHVRSLSVNCAGHPCAIEEESNRFEAHT